MKNNGGSSLEASQCGGGPELGWKNAVSGRIAWISPDLTPEELEEMGRRFLKVVKLPEKEVRAKVDGWVTSSVVARSLGCHVTVDMVVKEVHSRVELKGEVASYGLESGCILLHFKEPEDRESVLRWPWMVMEQILAMELWPTFIPTDEAICSVVIWVRLLKLPVALWGEAALRSVLQMVGDLVAVDDCTTERQRLGFAKATVWVDLSQPLRLRVWVEGSEGNIWQRFVYESLVGVCYRCGCLHAPKVVCLVAGEAGGPNRGHEGEGEAGWVKGRLCWGPWWVALRQWQPSASRKKMIEPSEPMASQPGKGQTQATSVRVDQATRSDGWMKA